MKLSRLHIFLFLLMAMLYGRQTQAQNASKVYIGGGDNPTGAWDGYLGSPNDWKWVRANADGYYLNVFPLNNNPNDATQNATLSAMANLFTNKNLFYETEATSYLNRVFDDDDKARIDIILANGFKVTYTTCNGEYTQSRIDALHWRQNRPVLAMWGPWVIGGDINSNATDAVRWRGMADISDGIATDGPTGLWPNNQGNVQEGSYSAVKYAHKQNKLAMIMLCPYLSDGDGNGPKSGDNYLKIGKDCVHGHEDNDAMPDLWVVSYYAAQLQQYPVTPEQVNGQPAGTLTGMAYYLLRHLRDPDKNAQLKVQAQSGVSVNANGADINLSASTQSYMVSLNNNSSWLDLIPVVRARVNDPQQAWNVSFQLNGQDISSAITGQSGQIFYKNLRLNPANTQNLTVTVASKSGNTSTAPLNIYLDLMPHPTTPTVNQTLLLHAVSNGYIGKGTGLTGNYYNDAYAFNLTDWKSSSTETGAWNPPSSNISWFTTPIAKRIDSYINVAKGSLENFLTGISGLDKTKPVSIRWTGFIEFQSSGTYKFYLSGADGMRLQVNNNNVIGSFAPGDPSWVVRPFLQAGTSYPPLSGQVTVSANQAKTKIPVVVEFYSVGVTNWSLLADRGIQLEWENADQGIVRDIVPQSQLYPVDVTTITTAGIDAESIRIYPNPAKDVLFIDNGSLQINSIVITDLQGHTVYQNNESFTGNKNIQLQELESGMYFIHLKGDAFEKTTKVMIR